MGDGEVACHRRLEGESSDIRRTQKTCDCCVISLRSDRSDSERQSPAGHIGGGWAKENEPRTITRIVTEDGPQALRVLSVPVVRCFCKNINYVAVPAPCARNQPPTTDAEPDDPAVDRMRRASGLLQWKVQAG